MPPFNLIVDDTKWKVGKNSAPPRSQSTVKQTALFKTLQTLISQGIVEKSQSPHYSQILMVPKPDGTFRMCVDYRALNDCTADASWPIPNIAEMLRRIGSHGPYSRIPSSSFNLRNKDIHCIHYLLWGISVHTTALWTEAGSILFARNYGHCSTCRTDLYDL